MTALDKAKYEIALGEIGLEPESQKMELSQSNQSSDHAPKEMS